jgi:hypothetical protein
MKLVARSSSTRIDQTQLNHTDFAAVRLRFNNFMVSSIGLDPTGVCRLSMSKILFEWCRAFEAGELAAVANTISDSDFLFVATNLPNPLEKAEWIGFIKILFDAAPDLSFGWTPNGQNGMDYRIGGTHTETLCLSSLGMADFKATGRSFRLPVDTYHFTQANGKITRIDVDPPDGAGLGGILAQLELV